MHFDQARKTGVVFHMMSGITEMGMVGMTSVGATAAEADQLFNDAGDRLRDEATSALQPQWLS